MKLIRFGDSGSETPGLLMPDGARVDASSFGEDYGEEFFESSGLDRLQQWADSDAAPAPRVDAEVRWAAPIRRPSKIVCIGLNYFDHVQESNMEAPDEPVVFMKATSSYNGPFDDIHIPRNSTKLDYEVELGIVIGKKATYVEAADALDHVAGYMLFNDYSERAFQIATSGQWVKGKSSDTFSPMGPFLATPDEISDPSKLDIWLKVNGESRQKNNTKAMMVDTPHLIETVCKYMSLLPGDLLSTGTPSGVGMGFKPPKLLQEGDVVEYGITGLGEARQTIVRP